MVLIANGAADQRRGGGELAHQPSRPLQPLDGRREAPDRKRMAIRSAISTTSIIFQYFAYHKTACKPACRKRPDRSSRWLWGLVLDCTSDLSALTIKALMLDSSQHSLFVKKSA